VELQSKKTDTIFPEDAEIICIEVPW